LVSTLDLDSGAWGDVTDANLVGGSGIIRVIIGLRERTALTTRDECRDLGQFLLIDRTTNAILAFGVVDHIEPPRPDVVWQFTAIDRAARVALKPQTPCLIWLTGLPAAGKSTIADRLEVMLHGRGVHTMALDGDNLRHGLCRDLGFSAEDRVENIRRAGETARLMLDAGLIVIASFVSPYRADRDMVRALCPPGMFIEVFVNTPLSLCQLRDPKGLYRRAKAGVLHGLTGVDAPYEPPLNPEIELSTADVDPDLLALEIIEMLRVKGCLPG
jgi:bifunctional enzyme CysN/CysC